MPTTDPKKKQEQNWQRRYGITRRAYNKLHAFQHGMCAGCGGPPGAEDGVFRIDHDHATGKVRGLLCLQCNAALGNVRDRPEALARLKLYLEAHAPVPTLPDVAGPSPTGPELVARTGAQGEAEAKDPRIPTPEVIAALKGHGLSTQEIAEEFDLDRPTVHALYNESQRSNRSDNARDVLLQKALPHALITIIQAVQDGDAKTAIALAKGLGVLREKKEPEKETTDGLGKPLSLEEWRSRVTGVTVERLTAIVGPPVDAGRQEALDAAWHRPAGEADPGGQPAGEARVAALVPAGTHYGADARPEAHPSASPRSHGSLGSV
jgi:uncharacterized protein (DUF433 family)